MTPEVPSIENELDIQRLMQLLWRSKVWIIGFACLFAAVALIYSYVVKQEWTATASTDKPTVNMLQSYYQQQQFLNTLSARSNISQSTISSSVSDDVYAEFIQQLTSYDTRRDFWLQSEYYQKQLIGDSRADAVLLAELVDNITYIPSDDKKSTVNRISLTVETASAAHQQLDKYMSFVTERTIKQLNNELTAQRAAWLASLLLAVDQQEVVAKQYYERELALLEQANTVSAENGSISLPSSSSGTDRLSYDPQQLALRIQLLKASGPEYDKEYYQNKTLLNELKKLPTESVALQPFRYLQTPQEPITRSKPRRLFLLVLWGVIGAMCGAGIGLIRNKTIKAMYN